MPQSRVRFIGSRELHRELPKVLETLENPDARFVLTIHSKPKAVIIGAEAFLDILRGPAAEDRLLALQLGALVQGLEASSSAAETPISRNTMSNWSGSDPARIGSPVRRANSVGIRPIPCMPPGSIRTLGVSSFPGDGITAARKIRTLAHTNPKRERGSAAFPLAHASG